MVVLICWINSKIVNMKKQIKRSKLRLWLGKKYYIVKKYYYWYFSRTDFAKKIKNICSPFEIFAYKSILLRKLKDVDMWIQYNKITNLEIAIRKINGLIIEPGQTFSYWRQIGRPTAKKGYLSGMILNNGKVINGIGGGLCQLSNLLYWITLNTPLTVIERWRHGYDVFPDVKRDLPFGSGATCAYPNIDLQIKNNTDQKFQLKLKVTDTYLIGKWFSNKSVEFRYEIYEKDHKIESDYRDGYIRNNKIFRKIINIKNNEEREELVTENHAIMMYNPLLENMSENKFNGMFKS